MRYVGCALIMLAGVLISSWFRSSLMSRLSVLSALHSLSRHICSRVSEYMEPPSVWASGFRTGCAAVDTLIERIAEGEPPALVYEAVGIRGLLPSEAQEVSDELFASAPRSEIGAQRRVLERLTARLSELCERERADVAERSRVFAVMALMLSAGAVILIV